MKFEIRPSEERGHYDEGWLDTYHTFSFSSYRNQKFTQFGPLRVLNEDTVEPSSGFPMHPHQNYEIFSYILSGNLTHSDSMGNTEVCKKGSVQFTSAGSGVYHSEFNRDKNEHVKFLQIWVKPRNFNSKPNYQTKDFTPEQKLNQLRLMIVPNESAKLSEEFIGIDQDIYVLSSLLESGKKVNHTLQPGRQIYIHVPIMSRIGSSSVEDSKLNGLFSSLLRKANPFISNYLKMKLFKSPNLENPISIKLSHGNNQEIVTLKEGDGCFIHSDSSTEEELFIEGVNSMTEFVLLDMKK
ncbi:predicted protein [Naegleria gruberi]|uniref:Predicted protein n=1 Tax=Naegleria gruberi TaxID=5762 RepID=D2VSH8_NAEGR|nr:uncharacterized protein NAEGRDRAFT_71946 [Naegleria gruberi]EFC40196.1 predicted protein [Naegleria gruberi]|eukprot:XP_002672940.1 predicted protein [Naegleria gruberi strain NEG-M]